MTMTMTTKKSAQWRPQRQCFSQPSSVCILSSPNPTNSLLSAFFQIHNVFVFADHGPHDPASRHASNFRRSRGNPNLSVVCERISCVPRCGERATRGGARAARHALSVRLQDHGSPCYHNT